jgi:hypothetical protein
MPYLELSVPFVHFLPIMRECTMRSPTGGPSITKFHTTNVCWKVVWKWSDCSLNGAGVELPRRHAFTEPSHIAVTQWPQESINRAFSRLSPINMMNFEPIVGRIRESLLSRIYFILVQCRDMYSMKWLLQTPPIKRILLYARVYIARAHSTGVPLSVESVQYYLRCCL